MKQLIGGFVLVLLFGACKSNNTVKILPIYGSRQAVTKR